MFRIIFIMLGGTLLGSAILTPFVFSALQYFIPDFGYPFARVFDRVAMFFLGLFVLLYRKDFGFSDFRGYLSKEHWMMKLGRVLFGICLVFCSVFAALIWVVHDGDMSWKVNAFNDELPLKLLEALGAAIIISLLEEGFFRVLLFNRLQQLCKIGMAALFCSLTYGIVHFIAPCRDFVYDSFSFTAGFVYLAQVFQRIFSTGFHDPYLGMVFIGLVLCFTIYKVKSFALCVGLHTGWVLSLKFAKYTLNINPNINIPLGAGERYFIVGLPEAWFSIIFVFTVIYLCYKFWPSFSKDERGLVEVNSNE